MNNNLIRPEELEFVTHGFAVEPDETNQRSEPRFSTPGKSVSILTFVEVPMKNQSTNGICLRLPRRVHVSLNQRIVVASDESHRMAVVRWIQDADPVGSEQLAGCEFVE